MGRAFTPCKKRVETLQNGNPVSDRQNFTLGDVGREQQCSLVHLAQRFAVHSQKCAAAEREHWGEAQVPCHKVQAVCFTAH